MSWDDANAPAQQLFSNSSGIRTRSGVADTPAPTVTAAAARAPPPVSSKPYQDALLHLVRRVTDTACNLFSDTGSLGCLQVP